MDGDGRKELELPPPLDLCELSPYQRQKQRDAHLAKPKAVFSYSSLWPTSNKSVNAKLVTKSSPHTEMLARPKSPLPKIVFVTKAEREAQKELEEDMTKEELKWLRRKPPPSFHTGVKKAALKAVCTPRLLSISLPKLKPLIINKMAYFGRLANNHKKSILRQIKQNINEFKTKYPPEADKIYEIVNGVILHTTCTGRASEKQKRAKYICELSKNQRKMFRRRMKALSLPRLRLPATTGPDRGPKKKIKEFEPWLTIISQPKYNIQNEILYDPFTVKASAKQYVATERILTMSKPKALPPPPPMLDIEGNEMPPRREWSYNSRRKVITTPRTIELATPKFVKKKAAEDTKENPFAVLRRALTAFCTQRVKELAEPRKR